MAEAGKPGFDALVVEITSGVTRFALGVGTAGGSGPVLGHYLKIDTSKFSNIAGLLGHYIEQHGGAAAMPPILAISHAGPMIGQEIIIPGAQLKFTLDEIKQAYPFEQIVHANDCVAMGSALSWLAPSDVASLAGNHQRRFTHQKGRYALVVPSYGLGAANIIHHGDSVQVIDSEGGHSNFAPCSSWQTQMLRALHDKGKQLSKGDIVSYSGLERIYSFVAGGTDEDAPDLRAQEIMLYARNEADEQCLEAIHKFAEALGATAGDFALMLGAIDGLFLVSPFINEILDFGPEIEAIIRRAFDAKTDFSVYMQRIPLYTIVNRRVSMVGVLRLACEGRAALQEPRASAALTGEYPAAMTPHV